MAAVTGALIPPTDNPSLERSLRARLDEHHGTVGSFGALEPLALRIGLIQNSAMPRLSSARLVVFAADHGLAVDDIGGPTSRSTATAVQRLLNESTPLVAFAHIQGIELTVVDSGVAEPLARHARLLPRKIAHGTRNCRIGSAMSTEQAHAAMRAGMEIGHTLGGDAVACAGIGSGAPASAALVLSSMSGAPLREFLDTGPSMAEALRKHLLGVLEEARNRHGHLDDPVELLAAVGGFEIAMMTGLMLAAASRRRLIVVDGIAACAALMVAAEIAPAVPEYCLFARSSAAPPLNNALELFGARPILDIGVEGSEGTGAALAWPLLRCAAALLGGAGDPEDDSAATGRAKPAAHASSSRR